jgi:tetratricopeptide (TPR) repeat protein
MLETIRQYAHEKLVEAGEAETGQDRHLQYYVTLSEKFEGRFRGPVNTILLDRLEVDLENMRLALEWSLERSTIESGLRLASALGSYWHSRGRQAEALNWIERLLNFQTEANKNKPLSDTQNLIRAKALHVAGGMAWALEDYSKTIKLSEESCILCRESGIEGKNILAGSLIILGLLFCYEGDLSRGKALLEEGQALFLEVGEQFGYMWSRTCFGGLAIYQQDYEKARMIFEEDLLLRRKIGDQGGMAGDLSLLGSIFLYQHEFMKAKSFMEESLIIYSEIKNTSGVLDALFFIGVIDWLQGKYELAAKEFEELLSLSRRQGDVHNIQMGFSHLSKMVLSQGDFKRANDLLEEGLALTSMMEHKSIRINLLCDFGSLALAQGEIENSAKYLNDALALCREVGAQDSEARVIYTLGKVDYIQRNILSSRKHFFEAIEKWPGTDWFSWNPALSLEALAILAVSQQEMEFASRLLGATEDYHQKFQYTRTPLEREERKRAAATARGALGEVAFTKAWEEGRAMTLEQAIAYAKEDNQTKKD